MLADLTLSRLLQVVPVPRQALAAATLAVGPGQGVGDEKEPSVELCEKMVRRKPRLSKIYLESRCEK